MNFLIILDCLYNELYIYNANNNDYNAKTDQEFNAKAATIFNIVRWYLKCNVSSIKNKLSPQTEITFELNRVHGLS